MVTAKKKTKRQLYPDPLTKIVAIQLDKAQSTAAIAWAKKHRVTVAHLLRESALVAAKAESLGVGFDVGDVEVWAQPRDEGKWPLKFTEAQHAAVSTAADKLGMTRRQFVTEAMLAHIGKTKLGALGALDAQRKSLETIGRRG